MTTFGDKTIIKVHSSQNTEMNLQEDYNTIINSNEYKEFSKEHKNFLANVFLDANGRQFNFYYEKKFITFFLEAGIIRTEGSEVYEEKNIETLNIEEVKISLEEAQKIVSKIIESKNEEINKKIIILQQKEVPFWNIIYITTTLNVLNVKINAISKEIIEQKFENIMNFKGTQ